MSPISSAYGAAYSGISDAFTRLERSGADLLRETSGASRASPEQAVVGLIGAEIQLKTSVATVRALDDMMGALLDIRI